MAAPPTQLSTIKAAAEAVLSDINSKDWAGAENKAHTISNSTRELQAILKSAKIPPKIIDSLAGAVGALENAVAGGKPFDSTIQANEILRIIPDIADYFIINLPTDFMRLESLSRDITLDIKHRDWPAAKSDARTVQGLWVRLKSSLHTAYKQDSDNFQSTINRLALAINKKDASAAAAEAKKLPDHISVLKRDFTRQTI